MKFIYALLFVISFNFIACNNSGNKQKEITTEASDNNETSEEQTIQNNETINLNNGDKWKVVDDMLVYIRNVERLVNSFEGNDKDEYDVLAQAIDKNIIDLTSNCTMEGQAHDELHKWLVPVIELSDELLVAEDIETQKKIYIQLKAAFKEFNIYFN